MDASQRGPKGRSSPRRSHRSGRRVRDRRRQYYERIRREEEEFLYWFMGVRRRTGYAPRPCQHRCWEQVTPHSGGRPTRRAGRKARNQRGQQCESALGAPSGPDTENRRNSSFTNDSIEVNYAPLTGPDMPPPEAYSPVRSPVSDSPVCKEDTLPDPSPDPSMSGLFYIPLSRSSPEEPPRVVVSDPLVSELLHDSSTHTFEFCPPPSTVVIEEVFSDNDDIIILN